ncbi:MAG TPA: alkaline phosphatase family protein [Acidobacteriaceae bacterium]|nr:alkaline phosphatase family protein [Acidobacteriaceae bacterium]
MTKRLLTALLFVCSVFLFFTVFHTVALASTGKNIRPAIPRIRHVFVITLENKNFSATFGPESEAPYLAETLRARGALLTQYYGTGHNSLDNYIAMVSGQATTPQTSADCNTYADFHQTGMTPDGQVVGDGCVYPASVKTLANQLMAAGLTWKGYMEDMGNDPARESSTCGHPALNAVDLTQRAEAPSAAVPEGDMYATRHDPFMYFHAIIDAPVCKSKVVNLRQLKDDLRSVATTPNFSFITPNLCDDGHDSPCANGEPGGLKSINTFLQKWIPILLHSPAYKQDGLIIINFDEGGSGEIKQSMIGTVVTVDGASCCRQQKGPNLNQQYPIVVTRLSHGRLITKRTLSFGGDRTGALLLSQYIRPGTVSNVPYNHYSLLKSLEEILGIHEYLGYAGQQGLAAFGRDVFTSN